MEELKSLPNIGNNLAEKLDAAGIKTAQDLINTGSEQAFLRIAAIDQSACINMLYALEGAIQGIRWHSISKERKQELLFFYKNC